MKKPVKIWYKNILLMTGEALDFNFSRQDSSSVTGAFGGFIAGRGTKAKASIIKIDDIKSLRFLMELHVAKWVDLRFEVERIRYQLVQYEELKDSALMNCRLLVSSFVSSE